MLGNLAERITREHDEILTILLQQRKVNSRSQIVAGEVRFGDELDEIFVSAVRTREEDDMVDILVFIADFASCCGNGKLDTDDRLYAGIFAGTIKFKRAIEISKIGERECGHAKLPRSLDEMFRLSESAEKRVVAMRVQVDEICHIDGVCHAIVAKRARKSSRDNARESDKTLETRLIFIPYAGILTPVSTPSSPCPVCAHGFRPIRRHSRELDTPPRYSGRGDSMMGHFRHTDHEYHPLHMGIHGDTVRGADSTADSTKGRCPPARTRYRTLDRRTTRFVSPCIDRQ